MRIKNIAAGVMGLAMLMASCSTPKNITYFQDVTQGTTVNPAQKLDIRVKPEDKLSIIVTTQDLALSTLFNLVQNNTRLGSTTTATTIVGNVTSGDGRVSYYTVDRYGDINFPVLGKLHIGGMTRAEVAAFIEKKLQDSDLVKDPIVTVEFVNTGISVIGEVVHPGRFEFNKQEIYRVDLTDMASVAASPVFYLQQNDVIYVEPNDKKKRDTTASGNTAFSPSFWVSIGSLGITIATLIVTLTN